MRVPILNSIEQNDGIEIAHANVADHRHNRSFRLNDETNLNVYDADFALEQVGAFEHDQERSRRITLEEWTNGPWTEKLKDRAAGLLRSQL